MPCSSGPCWSPAATGCSTSAASRGAQWPFPGPASISPWSPSTIHDAENGVHEAPRIGAEGDPSGPSPESGDRTALVFIPPPETPREAFNPSNLASDLSGNNCPDKKLRPGDEHFFR